MRILLTNDDGIAAEGLAVLKRIALQLSEDVWVCAPEHEQSGAGRALTLTSPVRVRKIDERTAAVSGTPTDCVMLAVQELIPGGKPELVLSGVNRGQNMGEDVTFSGTVAGALQGMAFGIPSIALSQAMQIFQEGRFPGFAAAEAYAPGIVARLVELGWPQNVVMNINFPDLDPERIEAVEMTEQGFRDYHPLQFERRRDPRGRSYFWMGFEGRPSNAPEGTDLCAVHNGRISVTPLHIDLTHRPTWRELKGLLGGAPPRLERSEREAAGG
jgi:5'-nucleotidase